MQSTIRRSWLVKIIILKQELACYYEILEYIYPKKLLSAIGHNISPFSASFLLPPPASPTTKPPSGRPAAARAPRRPRHAAAARPLAPPFPPSYQCDNRTVRDVATCRDIATIASARCRAHVQGTRARLDNDAARTLASPLSALTADADGPPSWTRRRRRGD